MATSNLIRRWQGWALVAGLAAWTLGPYGGCSCRNPLNGGGVTGAVRLYGGAEAGKVPANLVDDFNDGVNAASPTGRWQSVYVNGTLTQVWYNGTNPAYRINFWGGGTYTQADSFGSVYMSSLVSPGQPNLPGVPTLSGSGELQYGCPSCQYGRSFPGGTGCGQCYPFVQHGIFLSPDGAAGDQSVEFNGALRSPGADNSALGSHGLEFYLNVVSNSLLVKLIPLYLFNYSGAYPCNSDAYQYYQATVSAPAGGGTVTIPFTSFTLAAHGNYTDASGPIGTNLFWGTNNGGKLNATNAMGQYTAMRDGNGNFDSPTDLRLMAVEFDPNLDSGGSCPNGQKPVAPYQFEIDNLEFY